MHFDAFDTPLRGLFMSESFVSSFTPLYEWVFFLNNTVRGLFMSEFVVSMSMT